MGNVPRAWTPFRELDHLKRDFDDMLERFLGGHSGQAARQAELLPAIESFVRNGQLVVRAELAGVDPADVEITVNGDQLTIRGKRQRTEEDKRGDFYHREISYGNFERTLRLPEGVDTGEIKASLRKGVLELTVPARSGTKARKVPIEVVSKS